MSIVVPLVPLMGCSTPSAYDRMEAKQAGSRASADTYSSELFYMGQERGPERPAKHWDFFYKDCEIARRNRMLSRNEWECSKP